MVHAIERPSSRKNGGRRLGPSLVAAALFATSCAGSTEVATTPTSPAAGTEVDGGSQVVATQASVQRETRLGQGRAIAAASNGEQIVVATTTDIFIRSGDSSAFRSIALARGSTRAIELSPTGDRVAQVTDAGELALWTTESEPSLVADLTAVSTAEFRADGSLVVTGSSGVRVVDADDGSVLDEWIAPADRTVGPVAVADDGRVLLTLAGGPMPEVVTWNGGQDAVVASIASGIDDDAAVAHLVTSGERVAFGLVSALDPEQGRVVVFEIGASDPSWSVAIGTGVRVDSWGFASDGRLVIPDSAGIRVVDVAGVEVVSTSVPAPVVQVVNDLVVLADGSIMRFDERQELVEVHAGNRPVADIDVDAARRATVFVDASGRVGFIGPDATEPEIIEEFQSAPINDVAVSADGSVATASTDGVVGLFEAPGETGVDVQRLVHEEGNVDSVAFSADGTEIVTGVAQRRAATSFDDTVSFWPGDGGERRREVGGEAEDVAGCSFFTNRVRYAHDGSFVVATSHDFTVTVIDARSGDVLHTFPGHSNTVLDVAISPDDSTLVTSGDDSTMKVWDLETFELIADLPATMGGYWSLSYLPDGKSVVAGDLSGNVSVIDVATGSLVRTFEGTKLRLARTAVSPDGRYVASGAEGSVVRLWSTATGEIVSDSTGHGAAVSSVAFFADSRRFVSASQDGTAIIWNLTS
ncbi:MAG: WD40 repeat domain-containing protein [Ilumatobacter sp.]